MRDILSVVQHKFKHTTKCKYNARDQEIRTTISKQGAEVTNESDLGNREGVVVRGFLKKTAANTNTSTRQYKHKYNARDQEIRTTISQQRATVANDEDESVPPAAACY